MNTEVHAYFDRYETTIEGLFSLAIIEDGKARKLFERLPARSGQRGHTQTNWTRGKSPIPFGHHKLLLKPVAPETWPNATGIGEFYPIFSQEPNHRLIVNKADSSLERVDIGLHPENALPGSAGCVVLLVDTPERKATVAALFKFLRLLGAIRDTIPFTVL